jgi:isocitrate dehydrogenase
MTKITVAKGVGIAPKIMSATLNISLASGAKIEIEKIEVGSNIIP